jgi:hypothetical protein
MPFKNEFFGNADMVIAVIIHDYFHSKILFFGLSKDFQQHALRCLGHFQEVFQRRIYVLDDVTGCQFGGQVMQIGQARVLDSDNVQAWLVPIQNFPSRILGSDFKGLRQ